MIIVSEHIEPIYFLSIIKINNILYFGDRLKFSIIYK